MPDLSVVADDVDFGSEPARGREVIVTAQVPTWATGPRATSPSASSTAFEGFIGNDTISNIPTGQKREATVSWTPLLAGSRTITVQ